VRCCTVLQDPATLYWDTPLGLGPFRVVAASYGHPQDPKLAIDVRPQLQTRVGVSDRLVIRREESLIDWLGDPCPGVLKALRIRYVSLEGVAKGRRREVWVEESEDGHLRETLSLQVPTNLPLVVVFSAVYGTPGEPKRGRGKIDVTEFMQGRVDLADGKYLYLSKKEPLADLFGDPCPGRDKCLVLRYEIVGTEGRAEAVESDGRLLTPISISCTPMLAPLILVESATYGQSPEGIDERLQVVQRELSDLLGLQNRKDIGLPVSREDNQRLMGLRPLIADLEYLKTVTPRFVDVTACLQARVEELGGGVLELVAAREDVNQLFGNPLPGKKKELRVRYLVVGHDSERLTSLEETTSSGYPRNFILQRQGQVVVQGGEKLVINCKTDLLELFDDPCRGVRKKIKITYVARGLNGMVRVSERDRYLAADVIVGYYSREGFRESKLLAERHGLGAKHPTTTSTLSSHHHDLQSSCGSPTHSGPEEETTKTNIATTADAALDVLCFPTHFDDDDDDDDDDGDGREVETPSPLLTSPSLHPATFEGSGGEIMTHTLSEKRRERRRERRHAHQEELRRKEAERVSERRRMRAENARREREVARAVREAEDAERVRLLREAQEAEDAAPVAARLMRTLQRKAAAAVAAASSKTAAVAGVVQGRSGVAVAAEGGPTSDASASDILANDLAFSHGQWKRQQEQQEQRQNENITPGDADLTHDRRTSEVRVHHETTLGGSGSSALIADVTALSDEGEGDTLTVDTTQPTAATNARKKGRWRPKKRGVVGREGNNWGKETESHSPEERTNAERHAASPPLSRARAKAAAAAAAAPSTDSKGERPDHSLEKKSTLGSEVAPAGVDLAAAATAAPLQPQSVGMGDMVDRPRRKPSEERVGEPRAVFTHRASLKLFTPDAAAARDAAGVAVTTAGDKAVGNHQRRPSSKGRVGSVLPT
ncbi:unnamed protein product, partial [Pylaiella littoralis]